MSSISIIGLGNVARTGRPGARRRQRSRDHQQRPGQGQGIGRCARRRHCRDGRHRPSRGHRCPRRAVRRRCGGGRYGDALRGKIIVDITNPVAPDLQGFVVPDDSSGAQEIAKAAPDDAHVVKAFNTVFSHVGGRPGRGSSCWTCSSPATTRGRRHACRRSSRAWGCAWDTGDLFMARALENVGLLELGLMNHSVKHANFSLGITLLG